MKKMTEKLIEDGNTGRSAKMNLIATVIGGFLMLGGLACFIIKSLSVEYIDAKGILHENFFLIPVGLAFLATGILVIVVTLGAFLYNKKRLSK